MNVTIGGYFTSAELNQQTLLKTEKVKSTFYYRYLTEVNNFSQQFLLNTTAQDGLTRKLN